MRHLIFLFLIFCTILIHAQKASIKEEKISFKTYPYSDPDPVAKMTKHYPYFRFDGFTNTAIDKEWNFVVLENDYIKVYVAPEMGGKVWGAIEKSTGEDFIYFNESVKFRDISMRGACMPLSFHHPPTPLMIPRRVAATVVIGSGMM